MNVTFRLKGTPTLKLRYLPGVVGPSGTVELGTVTTGAPGTDVIITNTGTPQAAVLNFTIPEGDQGEQGFDGWTPELATVTDGIREVHQVVDWFGGEGTKPATGLYVGATGLVAAIADGKDIRGPVGPSGSVTDGDKGDIEVSDLGDTWEISSSAYVDQATAEAGTATAGIMPSVRVKQSIDVNAELADFNQAGNTGAVVRTIREELRDTVKPEQFWFAIDADWTAAINRAIAWLAANGGGDVALGRRTYQISTLTSITAADINIIGRTRQSVLETNSATGDVVTIAAGNCSIENVRWTSSVTRTAGKYLKLADGCSNFQMRNFMMVNPFIGIGIGEGSIAITDITGGYIHGVRANGRGIQVGDVAGTASFAVYFGTVVVYADTSGSASIEVRNVADLILDNCQALASPRNLLLNPGTGQSITSLKVIGGYIDTSTEITMAFAPTGTGAIQKVDFTGVWFQGGATNVILIDGGSGSAVIDGVSFSNCEAYNSTNGAGCAVVGNVRNFSWVGGKVAACDYGFFLSTSSGFDHHNISNARIGAIAPYAANGVGIQIDGQGDYNTVVGNDLVGSGTAIVRSNTQTHNRIEMNAGYNGADAPAGITVGASPFTFTNRPQSTTVYINAGTVSLISVNGTGMLQDSNHAVHLGPNDTLTVTYSSTPSMVAVYH